MPMDESLDREKVFCRGSLEFKGLGFKGFRLLGVFVDF